MTISTDLLDQLLDGVQNADDLLGEHGLMKDLKIRLMERMPGAELTAHPLPGRRLHRNLPRGGLYTAGLSTCDIRAHLEEVYGLRVSTDLVSRVTDAVLKEVSDWQNRALEPVYPIVFLDVLRVKIGDAPSRALLRNTLPGSGKPSSQEQGRLCGWASRQRASAKSWACGSLLMPLSGISQMPCRSVGCQILAFYHAFHGLRANHYRPVEQPAQSWRRGHPHCRLSPSHGLQRASHCRVTDGLKGFPEAINAALPEIHSPDLYRASGAPFPEFLWLKDRKAVAKDLKRIYKAIDDIEAEKALDDFEEEWGKKYPFNRPLLAAGMAGGHPVSRLSTRRPENHLYDKCD